ncbi:MAG: hypothetical protein KGM98_12750 [Bacteroidota bacterium]|nr:hypothetical protein [Bacteroidota bacterium]
MPFSKEEGNSFSGHYFFQKKPVEDPANSILVQDGVWYYTRIAAIAGTDSYECTTATGNYSNLGGMVTESAITNVFTQSGYIAFRLGDCHAGTQASNKLAEGKIASK